MSSANHQRPGLHSPPEPPGIEANEPRVSAPPGTTVALSCPLRILVVDDEESVRVSLKMLLQSDGHKVDTAMSAEEALVLFHQRAFDLVITDYALTGMNGACLAAALGAEVKSCPVLMITAYTPALPRTLPYVDCILGKPFSSQELRDAIAKVMKAGTPGGPSSASDHGCPPD